MEADAAPGPHPATLPDDTILRDCTRTQLRRGGPGGQHRNKVATAVRLTHTPTGLTAEANERRSAADNAPVALHRLRLRLACERRHRWAIPGAAWSARTRHGRIAVNPAHRDLPALLAESLDALHHHAGDPAATAEALGVSASQLDKLWLLHPPAKTAARAMFPL